MSLASTSEELPEGWEAVQDDQGRTYFWNVDTNDVMWTRPVVVKATKGIAARACRVLCLFTHPSVSANHMPPTLAGYVSTVTRKPLDQVTPRGAPSPPMRPSPVATGADSRTCAELEALRRDSSIASLTKQFSGSGSNMNAATTSSSPEAKALIEAKGLKSPALSVEALRKYNEAKKQVIASSPESPSPSKSPAIASSESVKSDRHRDKPPMVDLYK